MRFVRLLCASILFACGSSSGTDAGVDATAGDGGQDGSPGDAGGSDVVITDPQCAEAGAACQTCCSTVHPDASGIFDTMMAACSCGDGGACQAQCASSFCAGQASSTSCDQCISKQCYPNAKKACSADPACKAWLACLVPCP
jgi:hypothetical protein